MKKSIIGIVLSLASMPLVASALAGPSERELTTPDAQVVTLKESVEINDKIIRLGDLFTNTGELAGQGIAHAPAPGKRATFDATWLYRIAQAYRLAWRPMSLKVKATVESQSQVISHEEIEDEIISALIEKGIEPDMKVELSNRMLRLHVPGNALAKLEIEDIHYEPRTRRFAAIIVAPSGDPAAKRTRVTGRLHRVRNIPVLARRMLANEVISDNEITWIKVRANRLQPDTVLDKSDLIGRAPKRGMRAGFAIRTSEIRWPVLVEKGSLVTIILRTPQMLLTARGKALESGSDGDTLRITNTQSHTVVEAEVIGAGRVSVRPTMLLALKQ